MPKAKTQPTKAPSKKSQMVDMLKRPNGASVQELIDALQWQQHSVRGALVHLKNRDKLPVVSTVTDGTRRYSLLS